MGMQVIWLNFSFDEKDLAVLSPTVDRIFAFDRQGRPRFKYRIKNEMGSVKVKNGSYVEGGRFLMQGAWNTQLHGPLRQAYMDSLRNYTPADRLIYKQRISGIYDGFPDVTDFLKSRGIRTLLFAGVNTEYCVMATLQVQI